ncbi:unnamed protein product, partial [Urochloa humidicola]
SNRCEQPYIFVSAAGAWRLDLSVKVPMLQLSHFQFMVFLILFIQQARFSALPLARSFSEAMGNGDNCSDIERQVISVGRVL